MVFRSVLLPALILISVFSGAQSLQPTVIVSDGGYSVVTAGSLSWTIGEPISETYSIPGNFLTQGFQQPSILLVTTPDPVELTDIFVYPNPAVHTLYIDPGMLAPGDYVISMFDMLGNKIMEKNFTLEKNISQKWSLSLLDIANGMYMIHISSPSFDHSTRFIKTN